MKNFALRRAEARDFDDIAALRKQTIGGEYFQNTFDEERQNPRYVFAVLEIDEKPAAYAVMELVPPDAALAEVSVRSDLQRLGYASQLWRYAMEHATLRKVKNVFLEVRPSNIAALAWYKKLGFVEINRRKAYYSNPDEDAIVMKYSVANPRASRAAAPTP